MSRAAHCGFCGRPAPRLTDGFCSERCAARAGGAYRLAAHAELALTPPDRRFEARVLCPDPGAVDPEAIVSRVGNQAIALVRSDSRAGIDEFVERTGGRIFTLQRFAPGGIAAPGSRRGDDQTEVPGDD